MFQDFNCDAVLAILMRTLFKIVYYSWHTQVQRCSCCDGFISPRPAHPPPTISARPSRVPVLPSQPVPGTKVQYLEVHG